MNQLNYDKIMNDPNKWEKNEKKIINDIWGIDFISLNFIYKRL